MIRNPTEKDYGNLATALSGQRKFEEALRYFDEGLSVNPDAIELLSNQGLALLDMGQPNRASDALRRAIELDPTFPGAHFNLGVLHFRAGRYRDAIAQFVEVLRLDPGFTEAYLNLGSALAAAGEFRLALEPWRQLRQIQPNNAGLMYNIGLAQVRLGQHAMAIAAFEKARNLAPADPRIDVALARELATAPEAGSRDGPQAVAIAAALHRSDPRDPAIAELLASALAESGQFEEAILYAELGLKMAESDPRLAERIRARLALYRRQQSYHQPRKAESDASR